MRVGYGLGTNEADPSLGTAAGLLLYDTVTREFTVFPNPGLDVAPGHGQRPAAVRALATQGADVVVVRPGALCPESYQIACALGLQFLVIPPGVEPDTLMINVADADLMPTLPPSVYDR